jgi:hypothetical protein
LNFWKLLNFSLQKGQRIVNGKSSEGQEIHLSSEPRFQTAGYEFWKWFHWSLSIHEFLGELLSCHHMRSKPHSHWEVLFEFQLHGVPFFQFKNMKIYLVTLPSIWQTQNTNLGKSHTDQCPCGLSCATSGSCTQSLCVGSMKS